MQIRNCNQNCEGLVDGEIKLSLYWNHGSNDAVSLSAPAVGAVVAPAGVDKDDVLSSNFYRHLVECGDWVITCIKCEKEEYMTKDQHTGNITSEEHKEYLNDDGFQVRQYTCKQCRD